MGYIGDVLNMSIGFIVPLGCFALIAIYGFSWPALSKAESLGTVPAVKGH
jgi:FHS family L-fucose permease-like MFS transporter